MKREQFLKLTAGVLLAPYLAKIPAGAPKIIPAAATTLTVNNGSLFRAGDIIRSVTSGEALQVQRVDGPVLTVSRGFGTVAAADMRPDDELLILANASATAAAISRDFSLWNDDDYQPRTARVA